MRLTISPIPTTANSPTGPVKIKAYQFSVPVRLVTGGAQSAVFPALFDPGTNHNMAIREQHVRDWTGFTLRKLGAIKINGVVDERSLAFRCCCRARSDANDASSFSMPTKGRLPRIKHG